MEGNLLQLRFLIVVHNQVVIWILRLCNVSVGYWCTIHLHSTINILADIDGCPLVVWILFLLKLSPHFHHSNSVTYEVLYTACSICCSLIFNPSRTIPYILFMKKHFQSCMPTGKVHMKMGASYVVARVTAFYGWMNEFPFCRKNVLQWTYEIRTKSFCFNIYTYIHTYIHTYIYFSLDTIFRSYLPFVNVLLFVR